MIRKMEARDAAVLVEICRDSLGHKTSEEILKKNITALQDDAAYALFVWAEDEAPERVMGLLQAQKYDLVYGGNGWNIIALAVAPEAQGLGIGKKLVQALETYAQARGAAFIRLNSRVERPDAHRFYEHMGYTCNKTQKRFIKYFDC